MKKKILFVSVNRHQKTYFKTLGNYLSNEYAIKLMDYNFRYYLDAMLSTEESCPEVLTKELIAKIIRFSLKKGEIRTDFDVFRKFLHSRRQLERSAKRVFTYFYNYLTENKVDIVCVWNGNSVERAAIIEAAKALGKKTIFFENGLLPNTTTMDPIGVNYFGTLLQKNSSFFKKVVPDPAKLQNLFAEQLVPRGQKHRWYQRNASPSSLQADPVDLSLPYIFVPFQVHDDTQVVIHSPHIHDMQELTAWVAKAVARHNETSGDNLRIIIKEHPSDNGRIDYTALRNNYPEITFVQNLNTETLINNAKAVVTINSSVGIESLLKHKKVIALGNSGYSIEGIVKRAASIEELTSALDTLDSPVDEELINNFLYYVRYVYSVAGSWCAPSPLHLQSVRKRVKEISEGLPF